MDFSGRLEQAEDRIDNIEDDIAGEKTKIAMLEKQVSELTSKIDDLENRSCHSNLRLVNLPGKVEKGNAAAFLEEWLPDIFVPETFPAPLVIERAHRLPGAPQSSAPRVMIMKFLNACLLILQVWSRLLKNWKPSRLAGRGSWDCTEMTIVSD